MTQSFRRGGYLVLSLGVVAFFGGYVLLYSGGAAARSEIARIKAASRKTGMPLELSDLGLRPVPAELNAAPILLAADDTAKATSQLETMLQLAEGSTAGPLDRITADVAIGEMKPYFDQLAEAAARPRCYFEKDWNLGAKVMFPEFAGMKRDVRDLCYKADFLDRSGDRDGTIQNLSAAYKIAVDAGSEPIMIGMLVEDSSRLILDKEWETLLNRHSHDPKYLAAIDDSLKSQTEIPQLKKFLGGEVVYGRLVIQTMTSLSDLTGQADDTGLSQELMKSRMVKSSVEAKYLSAWSDLWAKLPSDPNNWQGTSLAIREMDAEVQNDNSIANKVTQILMPTFSNSADSVGVVIARHRMLQAAVALAKIRNQTGKYPVVLPSEIAKNAIDPFDGNLLRYHRDGSGFVLYSIGIDRVDNGGVSQNMRNDNSSGFDEVISIS